METLKEKIMSKKENFFHTKNYKNFYIIKARNSCHKFKIFFSISQSSSIPTEFDDKNCFSSSIEGEKLIIKAELLNKEESYFNENNEEIEISEKYLEIYSLAELKNNNKGCAFFTELDEFKDAFIKAIDDNNYELLIIKNVLLLTVNIINMFGIIKICHLLLKPCINNNNNNTNVKNRNDENIINLIDINEENNIISPASNLRHNKRKNKSKNKENNYYLPSNYPNKLSKEFLDKKILKLKKYRSKKILNNNGDNTPIDNINTYDISENNNENKNKTNICALVDNFIENVKKNMKSKLPEFEEDSLIKNSSIIKNFDEVSLIGDMISHLKSKKYRLIYRGTRDGDSANRFHLQCDNFNNLIVLIETQKGLRFGGFTSNRFKGSSHMKFDNNAFLFSLDLKKVYNIIPSKYAIYCYPNSGPCFSQGSLYIPNNFFKKFGKTGNAGGPYQFEKDYELNNGEEKFIVKELEIFQVLIEDC